MNAKIATLLLLGLFPWISPLRAQDDPKIPPQIQQLLKNLKYQQGEIDLRDGLAKLTVPPEFNYLGPDDTETVLVKLWGNPPSNPKPLGMLMPAGLSPLSTHCWIVTSSSSL